MRAAPSYARDPPLSPFRRLPFAAAPEQCPEDPPDDVLSQSRRHDLATGPDRRVDRLLTRLGVSLCLPSGRPSLLILLTSCPLLGGVDLPLLTRQLSLLLRGGHLVEAPGGRRIEALARCGIDCRLARRRKPCGDPFIRAVPVDGGPVLRVQRTRGDHALERRLVDRCHQ